MLYEPEVAIRSSRQSFWDLFPVPSAFRLRGRVQAGQRPPDRRRVLSAAGQRRLRTLLKRNQLILNSRLARPRPHFSGAWRRPEDEPSTPDPRFLCKDPAAPAWATKIGINDRNA